MLLLVSLAAALAPAEAPKAAVPDRTALAKLQGRWQLTRHEHGGEALPAKRLAPLTLEVSGVRLTVRDGTDTREESDVVALDPRATPAVIDVKVAAGSDRGKLVRGIWKLQGGALTFCLAEPGKERPGDFAAKEGSGQTLLVFRRAEKKGASPRPAQATPAD